MDTDEFELDAVDRGILHLLQEDARNNTTTMLGEKVGVSATTVGNRIDRMEADGVIKGYYPDICYSKTGLQLHLLVTGEVPVNERKALTEKALGVTGVVTVQEILTGVENLLIEAVAQDVSSVTKITSEIENLGIDIQSTQILGSRHIRPFDHFGTEDVDNE